MNVVGSMSIEHRVRKLLFYHNPQMGQIYGFQIEYLRGDKKTTVAGQWQVNEIMKKKEDTQKAEMEIESNDWIAEMKGEIANGLISYLEIASKRGKKMQLGKSGG